MKTSVYVLAKFLECEPYDCQALDAIKLDVDEFFDDAKDKTLNGLCETVYNKALEYLTGFYEFAQDKLKANPELYNGSILNWDQDLLMDAIEFMDPKKDLHWSVDSTHFYIELDYWDLYRSVVGTVNEDYDSKYSFKELISSYTEDFYGGEYTPNKYESLLL